MKIIISNNPYYAEDTILRAENVKDLQLRLDIAAIESTKMTLFNISVMVTSKKTMAPAFDSTKNSNCTLKSTITYM